MRSVQIKRIELALGRAHFDHATDRSVLASINIARQDLVALMMGLPSVMELDNLRASVHLNERPVSVRGKWFRPAEILLEIINRL